MTSQKPTWGLNLFTMKYFPKEILKDENTDLEQRKNSLLYFKALINVLQEGDIQIRGFKLQLPVDVQFIFTANPEDYTNRGSIVII